MTRDPDDARPGDDPLDHTLDDTLDATLDDRVRAHLRAGVPGHRAGFWEDLAATLETTPRATSQESSEGVQGTVIPFRPSPRTGTPGTAPVGDDADGDVAMTTGTRTDSDQAGGLTPDATDLGGGDRWTQRPTRRWQGARGWWAAAAAAAVVLATASGVGLALRGGHRSDDVATPGPKPVVTAPTIAGTPTSTPSASSAATVTETTKPTATHPVGVGFAVDTMPTANAVQVFKPLVKGGTLGKPRGAWTWSDGSHTHVMLATIDAKTSSGPDGNGATYTRTDSATTRIYYAYGASATSLHLVRTMVDDNGGYCDVDFGADITPNSVSAFDADGDGLSEVTIGWNRMCRGDPGQVAIKLAMLSGTKKFILRGDGVSIDSDPIPGITLPPASFTAEPAPAQWPGKGYEKTVSLFHRLWK